MDDTALFGIAAAAVAAGVGLVVFYFRRRLSPEELERRRLVLVNSGGRMADAAIVDFQDGVIQYRYEVRGVAYTAAQDLKILSGAPQNPAQLLGVATVKYLQKDPANSIVYCEGWSGLRPAAGASSEVHSMEKES